MRTRTTTRRHRLLLTGRDAPQVRRGIGWLFGRRNPFTMIFGA